MVIRELKPSQHVAGRWLAVLEDGTILRLGERAYRGVLAALSPTRLSDGGVYSALVGAMEA